MLWMGSCFVESMAKFLDMYHYQAIVNPFGVIFHPLVLEKLIGMPVEKIMKANFERKGIWQNFWLGAPFAAESEIQLNHKIEEASKSVGAAILNSNWLIMTWGTAFWYAHEEWGMVGKCHKFPQNHFEKKLSTTADIVMIWKKRIAELRTKNPGLKVLLTLSPVRHTRDGLEGNAISKSTLRLAIEELRTAIPNVFYFPAFEIVLDELGDYRFFEKDLIHPNEEAVAFIWNQFSGQFFPNEELNTNELAFRVWQQERHLPNVDFGAEYLEQMNMLDIQKRTLTEKLQQEKI